MVFHSFRHTVVNMIKQKGFPREQAAGLLGHNSGEGFTYTVYADVPRQPQLDSLD